MIRFQISAEESGTSHKNRFPLLWAVVKKLPRAGTSFRISIAAGTKSS